MRDGTMDLIADGLDTQPRVTLFSAAQIRALTPIDPLTYKANLSIADPRGSTNPNKIAAEFADVAAGCPRTTLGRIF